jgi:hypothetical protein
MFSQDEVNKVIRSKKNAAAGPDVLNYAIIKQLPQSTVKLVTELFNNIWNTGHIPNIWQMAAITPISKSGKGPHDANSYRPIYLTSHLGKIMETIKKRLQFYLEKSKLLSQTIWI